jgi:hypothetical protein
MNRGLYKKEYLPISRPAYNLLATLQRKHLYIFDESNHVWLDELESAGYIKSFIDMFGHYFILI